jgi:hypothetical protein
VGAAARQYTQDDNHTLVIVAGEQDPPVADGLPLVR